MALRGSPGCSIRRSPPRPASPSSTPPRSLSSTPPGSSGRCTSSSGSTSSSDVPAPTPRCGSPPTPPIRRGARCCSACRSAPPRSRPSCCSSSSSGRRVDDARADELLAEPDADAPDGLAFCRHYLRSVRRYRPHLLTEPEEKVLAEKSISANSAWARLFGELVSGAAGRPRRRARSRSRSRSAACRSQTAIRRRSAAEAVSATLEPGLRTRALHLQHARLRQVRRRPAAPLPALAGQPQPRQRGLRRVGDGADRGGPRALRHPAALVHAQGQAAGAATGSPTTTACAPVLPRRRSQFSFGEARELVLDTYESFSPEAGRVTRRFFDEHWIDAPVRPNKRGGAFCSYTVPSVHPYVMLNFTAQPPRRADDGARARPRAARRAGPAPGRVSPVHAADAGRDRLGVRRDAGVRAAAGCSADNDARG